MPMTYRLVLVWLTCQAPGAIGSVLGRVGPVSYCDFEIASLICSLFLGVFQADPSLRDTLRVAGTLSNYQTAATSLSSAPLCNQCVYRSVVETKHCLHSGAARLMFVNESFID